jgi:DNA-directed RNA polymerase subunit omega
MVDDRFELVILAAQRTRQILAGEAATIDEKDGKKTVLSLREIAAGTVAPDALRESSIKSFRSFSLEEELDDTPESVAEEDTYNPYLGIEIKSLESDKISIVTDAELEGETDTLSDH